MMQSSSLQSSAIDSSNGESLTVQVTKWAWSDDELSPQPNDSPSLMIHQISSISVQPDINNENNEEEDQLECLSLPIEISEILSDIRQMYTPETSTFGAIVSANASSLNFMENDEMEKFFDYMLSDITTSPLRYGKAIENAFITWISVFTSSYNTSLLNTFFIAFANRIQSLSVKL